MSTPDELEQGLSPTGDAAAPVTPEVPLEASEADVVEQAAETAPTPHVAERDLPLEAPEADAYEQAHVVPQDDEDRPV